MTDPTEVPSATTWTCAACGASQPAPSPAPAISTDTITAANGDDWRGYDANGSPV